MPQLLPHVILRCQSGDPAPAAVLLRYGGYAVTKVVDDAFAARLAACGHADAIVVELPVLGAISFVRRIAVEAPEIPLLVISSSGGSICRLAGEVRWLAPRDMESELVAALDRLLADDEGPIMPAPWMSGGAPIVTRSTRHSA